MLPEVEEKAPELLFFVLRDSVRQIPENKKSTLKKLRDLDHLAQCISGILPAIADASEELVAKESSPKAAQRFTVIGVDTPKQVRKVVGWYRPPKR